LVHLPLHGWWELVSYVTTPPRRRFERGANVL
jgi:hypothetical protein